MIHQSSHSLLVAHILWSASEPRTYGTYFLCQRMDLGQDLHHKLDKNASLAQGP